MPWTGRGIATREEKWDVWNVCDAEEDELCKHWMCVVRLAGVGVETGAGVECIERLTVAADG